MVHDPASSLRTGDIISISSGWRVSKNVHHVVRSILAPFGEPIEARPAVPTEEQRMAERVAKQDAKIARKQARERGYILPKESYTPEELQTIKERRQAKRDKWIQDYEAAKGEPMPDKLKFRFMNYQEKVEYCKANDLPIPEHKPVVKKEKVAATPPTPEELAAIRQQRQAKREERSKLYKERTGTELPNWQLYSWMNIAERKEWHERDPETARPAELKWRENREIKYNQLKNL
jgi:hypothetical protein